MPKGIYKREPFTKKHKENISKAHLKNGHKPPVMKGEDNPRWKGGIQKDGYGYVLILKPEHPRADRHGYVKESVLVIENEIGRYLRPEEVVHHNNRKRDDNRIKNLRLFSNDSEHQKFHNLVRPRNCYGQFVKE